MEPIQPQQPIGQPIPPSPVQPQQNTKTKPILVGLGVVVLLVIAGGVWWMSQKGTLQNSQNEQSQNTQQEQQTQTQGLIKYGSIATPALKTIPLPNHQATVRILNVGIFTEGQFKDKNLALALFEYANTNPTYGVSSYAYFVSDNLGNPIAWDKNFVHDQGFYGMGDDIPEERLKDFVGLADNLQQNLTFLPKEFSTAKNIMAKDNKTIFSILDSLVAPDISPSSVSPVGMTETGWQIVRKADLNTGNTVLPPVSYFVVLPFGKMIQISPEPDFVNADDVPQLSWTVGTKPVASYRYGQHAYGWQDCYDGISSSQLQSTFVQTGTTAKGDAVYEVDAQKHPKVYQCLHEKTKRYVYDETTKKGTYQDTVSYSDFIQSHPMFFWKHPLGDLVAFVRSDVVPPAEKGKPVIYLYPQKSERVSVKVFPLGGFTKTDPDYDNGWIVDATPDGKITNTKDGKDYPYLFWEGGKDGVVETPVQGFVVAKNDISSVLNAKLSLFSLNKQERDDFLEFWVPELSSAPYYFITFISRSEIDRTAPLSIYPQPDTVIRVLMDYKPLTESISVKPLIITPTERNGFTVVEWGGIFR